MKNRRSAAAAAAAGMILAACGPSAPVAEEPAAERALVTAATGETPPEGYVEVEMMYEQRDRWMCGLRMRPSDAGAAAWSIELVNPDHPVKTDESAFAWVDASVESWEVEVRVCEDPDYDLPAFVTVNPHVTFEPDSPYFLREDPDAEPDLGGYDYNYDDVDIGEHYDGDDGYDGYEGIEDEEGSGAGGEGEGL